MKIERFKQIFFLGIGGIGMSALARYFNNMGVKIFGYDITKTSLTDQLEKENIIIHFEDNPALIPENLDAVVYTPAIPNNNRELNYIKEKKIPLFKRSEILGTLTKNNFTIAIAGTHGKTTISSMLAHIFHRANIKISALVGGIVNGYNSNFIGQVNGDVFIVEADEFDRSFHTLHPDIALISSIDADHLDVYKSKSNLIESYRLFTNNIKANGKLILKKNLQMGSLSIKHFSYSLFDNTDCFCYNLKTNDSFYTIDLKLFNKKIDNINLNILGQHNIENAIAACSLAYIYGIDTEYIKNGIKSFPGVKRRFELVFKNNECTFIDDYAHHPEELTSFITSVKKLYPQKKILGVFQPHLYSRTRDFVNEFAKSLELLDEIVIMDIYPARELPITGINAQFLLDKINHTKKHYKKKEEIIDFITNNKPEVLLTMGAGNIDQLVEPIKNSLLKK